MVGDMTTQSIGVHEDIPHMHIHVAISIKITRACPIIVLA